MLSSCLTVLPSASCSILLLAVEFAAKHYFLCFREISSLHYKFKALHFYMLRNKLFQLNLIFCFSEVKGRGFLALYQPRLHKGYGHKVAAQNFMD